MKFVVRAALLLLFALQPVAAFAGDPPPLDSYGDLPDIEEVTISPDGKSFAMVTHLGGERKLVVFDDTTKIRASTALGDNKLRYIDWAGNDTLMMVTSVTQNLGYGFTADSAEFSLAFINSLDGKAPQVVFGRKPSMVNAIWGDYGYRQIEGKWYGLFGGVELARRLNGKYVFEHGRPALFRVDLETNRQKKIAFAAPENFWRGWLIGPDGEVAATLDFQNDTGAWSIENAARKTLASGRSITGGVGLVSLGRDGQSLIYFKSESGLHLISNGTKFRWQGGEPVKVYDGIDIERIYVDPRTGFLLGYKDGETGKPVLFDHAQTAILHRVYAAFPNLDVNVVDWTPDFKKFIVHTSGNRDSGSWFIVDIDAKRADAFGYDRELIYPDNVGPISTFEYRAADGMQLDGILSLPPDREAKDLPVIMLPHGGPESQDSERFDWWAQAFASRGYAVFQPNFRGSTNRDLAFRRAGYGQWGRAMQTDISDGLAALAQQGIVDPARACIMGASYGGYAALAGVTLQHGLYRCSVAVAPVSDLKDRYNTENRESGMSRTVRASLRELMGDPSTYNEVSPRRHAAQADAPILLVHGRDDTVVAYSQSTHMADALRDAGKTVEFVSLDGEDHWLSRAETRKQMLAAAMEFVQKYNPAD